MTLKQPFKPMLAKSANNRTNPNTKQISFVESCMKSDPFLMDIKLDGERMIFHIDKTNSIQPVTLITRNGNYYCEHYPAIANSIKNIIKVDKCILDGEIIAWDDENKNFLAFGENRTVGKEEAEAWKNNHFKDNFRLKLNRWLTYVVFDIVYLVLIFITLIRNLFFLINIKFVF
jgi:ATP-dependent DNA ligase